MPLQLDALEKQLKLKCPSPLQKLTVSWPGADNLDIWVKRDDLIHPVISGNKWRKLKYALVEALPKGVKQIVSFGGGHSNHLHALGYVCHQLNIPFTAIVRGNYSANLTLTLTDLLSWRAQIQYVDKITYQKRDQPNYLAQLQNQYPGALIIPEGGSQQAALKGVAEIISELDAPFDYILSPVASGGTLAGLIQAVAKDTQILGVGVLKGEGYLEELVKKAVAERFSYTN